MKCNEGGVVSAKDRCVKTPSPTLEEAKAYIKDAERQINKILRILQSQYKIEVDADYFEDLTRTRKYCVKIRGII